MNKRALFHGLQHAGHCTCEFSALSLNGPAVHGTSRNVLANVPLFIRFGARADCGYANTSMLPSQEATTFRLSRPAISMEVGPLENLRRSVCWPDGRSHSRTVQSSDADTSPPGLVWWTEITVSVWPRRTLTALWLCRMSQTRNVQSDEPLITMKSSSPLPASTHVTVASWPPSFTWLPLVRGSYRPTVRSPEHVMTSWPLSCTSWMNTDIKNYNFFYKNTQNAKTLSKFWKMFKNRKIKLLFYNLYKLHNSYFVIFGYFVI